MLPPAEQRSMALPHRWYFLSTAMAGWCLTCVCRWRQNDGSGQLCWSQRGQGSQLSMWLKARSRPRSWHQKLRRLNRSTKLLVVPGDKMWVSVALWTEGWCCGGDCIAVCQASSATLVLPSWGLRLSSSCCPAPTSGKEEPCYSVAVGEKPTMHGLKLS